MLVFIPSDAFENTGIFRKLSPVVDKINEMVLYWNDEAYEPHIFAYFHFAGWPDGLAGKRC